MTMQKKDVVKVTRYVLVAADRVRTEKPVQLTRPMRSAHDQCEADGPDHSPERENDEIFTTEALCAPFATKPMSHWLVGTLSPTD